MASPEQLARFFSALQFDQEPPPAPRVVRVPGPRPVEHTRPAPPPQYVVAKRDPYRPVDPAWFILGALVLSLVFAAMRMGLQP